MIEIGNTYQQNEPACPNPARIKKSYVRVIAIDLYGRILVEDKTKPKTGITFWDKEDFEKEFKRIF